MCYTGEDFRVTILPAGPGWNVVEVVKGRGGTLCRFDRHPVIAWHFKEHPVRPDHPDAPYELPHVQKRPITWDTVVDPEIIERPDGVVEVWEYSLFKDFDAFLECLNDPEEGELHKTLGITRP